MSNGIASSASPSRFSVSTRTGLSRWALISGLIIIALLLAMPFLAPRTVLKDMFFVLTLIGMAQYWNLLAGYAGIISIGQQAYVGLGAYVLFACSIFLGFDPVLSILAAAVIGGLMAVPVAKLIFRLNGAYLAVGTWVMAEVFRLSFAQVKSLGGGTGTSLPTEITNGSASVQLVADLFGLRASVARDTLAYWLAAILCIGTVLLAYAILRSRQGLALAAIRDNQAASGSIGIDQWKTKLWVYVVAGAGAAAFGALIFFQTARISPDAAFSVTEFTAFVLFVVIIGGIGTIEGPIIGAIILFLLRDWLSDFGAWYLMVLGLLAIGVMLVFPKGLWGSFADRYDIHLFPIRRRLIIDGEEKP
jgi:branched-chain amino acid transport system permease protein